MYYYYTSVHYYYTSVYYYYTSVHYYYTGQCVLLLHQCALLLHQCVLLLHQCALLFLIIDYRRKSCIYILFDLWPPDGVLAHFINYGHREMQPMATAEIYQKVVLGIALADCASRCLVATEFQCVSFDYTYAGVRSTCSMSKYIAANVYGLGFRSNVRNNHYEKIGTTVGQS